VENYKDLIKVAQDDTGLSDFGGDSFKEGLEILVNALNSEAKLTDIGDYALRDRILMHLKQRLEIEGWYRRHPEIDDEEIMDPLFGVSLPRTGSTALSYLLSSDPGIRYLRVWESSRPCPPPSTVEGPDPRRGEHANAFDEAHGASRRTPTGIDGAMECQDLMALTFASQTFQAFAQIPSYSDWFMDADLTETYLYEKRTLKLLQWGEPAKPWRLKAPTHILFMDYLDNAFPNAKFVMTHRDPTDVILSVATVYTEIIEKFTDAVDNLYIGELNERTWTTGMNRLIEFREKNNNDARFFDIHFRAMHDDPIGEVRALYAWLGQDVSQEFADAMDAWWKSNDERERFEKPDPSVFGIDYDRVRAEFAPYLARMDKWAPYPRAAA